MTISQYFELAAKFAPLGTTAVALGAAIIAWRAIAANRDIARRRAAIDFFLRTEMDKGIVDLYRNFRKVATTLGSTQSMAEFAKTDAYHDVRTFLNICELISVGIIEGGFSERVSFAYWGDVLPNTYRDAKPLIEYVRTAAAEGSAATYIELEKVCAKWAKKR